MLIYDKIKSLLEKRSDKMGVSELEKLAGLSSGAITKWNISVPKADALYRVAKIFSLPVEYFLDDNAVIVTEKTTYMQNSINNSDNSLVIVSNTLSKQEDEIIQLYRKLSIKCQVDFVSYILQLSER